MMSHKGEHLIRSCLNMDPDASFDTYEPENTYLYFSDSARHQRDQEVVGMRKNESQKQEIEL